MTIAERFWWILTMAAVGWYATVAVYVAFRGVFDIRGMLRRLDEDHVRDSNEPS